ncbi:MAG: methionyl-tRNA formyltransferase [Planctomycetota bacterium]|jgi:methionyl-tRNA formyltransferase|nr:methionyl-tRNA formyltransferase [Planctomycetota bacterium]
MTADGRLRIAFLGSGAFGLPTLEALGAVHDVVLAVSQPDRPAGRGRQSTCTPISARVLEDHARTDGLFAETAIIRTDDVNAAAVRDRIADLQADAMVVIAFGQKLGSALLDGRFAVNLHASLLPRWRGAAPINRAMMAGDLETGVSVISLAERMDAGGVHAMRSTPIDPAETAGELHDRLARLGIEPMLEVLERWQSRLVETVTQDEHAATPAAKLSKSEATVDFAAPSSLVRGRIHGLVPWPGCQVDAVSPDGGSQLLRIHRVLEMDESTGVLPGTIGEGGVVGCETGSIRLLEVQVPGGRAMAWEDLQRGRPFPIGTVLRPRSAGTPT